VARYVACRFYIRIPFNEDLYWTDIQRTVSFCWHQNSHSKLTWAPPISTVTFPRIHHTSTMAFATISSHINGLNHGDSVVYDLSIRCQCCWGRGLSATQRGEERGWWVMMPHATTTIIEHRYSAFTNIDKQHQLSTSNNSGSGGAATTTIDQSFATTISYNSHSMRLTRWHDCTVLVRQPLKTRKTSTPKITNKED
jgi:hypothetical protein